VAGDEQEQSDGDEFVVAEGIVLGVDERGEQVVTWAVAASADEGSEVDG
jgi:hypothetical protein